MVRCFYCGHDEGWHGPTIFGRCWAEDCVCGVWTPWDVRLDGEQVVLLRPPESVGPPSVDVGAHPRALLRIASLLGRTLDDSHLAITESEARWIEVLPPEVFDGEDVEIVRARKNLMAF